MIFDEMSRECCDPDLEETDWNCAAADRGFVGHYVVLVAYDAQQDIFQVSDPGVAAGVRAAQRVGRCNGRRDDKEVRLYGTRECREVRLYGTREDKEVRLRIKDTTKQQLHVFKAERWALRKQGRAQGLALETALLFCCVVLDVQWTRCARGRVRP